MTPDAPAAIDFSIPAQDLGAALTSFADKAGLRLLFPSDLVAGRRSPGLSGTYTRDAAPARLPAGTGLTYRFTSANTVAISSPSARGTGAAGDIQLGTLEITGQGDDPQVVALATSASTKTRMPLIETPQAISVVTRGEMDQCGAAGPSRPA